MDLKQINQYEAFHKIGESTTSVIYKAFDSEKQIEVSVKVLKPSDSIKRDLPKIKLYAGIKHQNLCKVHAVEKYEDTIIIVSDYIEGTSLQKLLVKSKYPKENILELLQQISNGLSALHKHNLPHGNIKPSNIIINRDSQAILTDVGLSPFEDFQYSPEFVAPYEAFHYLSPEQVNNEPVCRQSDFFAMGVIAYRILFDKLPFEGQNEDELIKSILSDYPQMVSPGSNGLKRTYSLLLGKLLAKDKLDRFENIFELKATISEIKLFHQNNGGYIIEEHEPNPRKSLVLSVLVVVVVVVWVILSFFFK